MTSPAVRRPSMPVSAPRRARVPLAWPVTLAAGAAVVVGRLAERGRLVRSVLGAALGMMVIHLGGWAQLAVLTGNPVQALQVGTLPFIAQDLLKVALAGLVLWRGHHALRLRA